MNLVDVDKKMLDIDVAGFPWKTEVMLELLKWLKVLAFWQKWYMSVIVINEKNFLVSPQQILIWMKKKLYEFMEKLLTD